MLIVTVGLPGCGKSTFVDLLIDHLDKLYLIRPGFDLNTWAKYVRMAAEHIESTPRDCVTIFDTCGSSPLTLMPLSISASKKDHDIIIIYVNATPDNCKDRTLHLKDDVIAKYISRIFHAIKEYRELFEIVVVHNNSTISDLYNESRRVGEIINDKLASEQNCCQ